MEVLAFPSRPDVPMAIDQPGTRAVHAAGRQRRWVTSASYLWAALPLLSIGFGTWATFLYAAIRLRSVLLGAVSAVFACLTTVALIADAPAVMGPLASTIFAVAVLGSTFGASAYALAIRGRLVRGPGVHADDPLQRAVREGAERRRLRQAARALAASDPGLARELGIGRPDLHRDYEDGGVVDVNHVPAGVISALPGMDTDLAATAVTLRRERGPFVSADDLSAALDLPPASVQDLADRTIYL